MNNLSQRVLTHPFFRGMSEQHLEIVAQGAARSVFEPNEIIFRQGEPANRFYLLESGKVALEAHEPGGATALIQHLSGGDVLGWSWLFPPFVWNFQARAIDQTQAIGLNGAHLLAVA